MRQWTYALDEPRRRVGLEAIRETCAHRGWRLLAGHVRSTHVHVVVEAAATPERVMSDLEAYASRRLCQEFGEAPGRRRWARHGSTRLLVESQVGAVGDRLRG